ncbi:MAG: UbiA family prenyltransferase [Gammaproteobacteria bacterium]|nr:UbiA family prenyltransferase [Gammaproteobacteria bacterium]
MGTQERLPPLCVDLDGTLIHADLSIESIIRGIKKSLWTLFALPAWLIHSKSRAKAELAKLSSLDASSLPYNEEVVRIVEEAKRCGRKVILVTGSNQDLAQKVQDHLGIFDDIMASDDETNLTGSTKASALIERFGKDGYEYVANGAVDIPVWESAVAAITVNAPRQIVRRVAALGKPHKNLVSGKSRLRIWLKAIRIHQWAKNSLIFVPLMTAHRLLDVDALLAGALAFLSFSLCASATYIFNDLLDIDADRKHPRKRNRPFAAGLLSVQEGLLASVALLAVGIASALLLPQWFQLSLLAYLTTTVLYSCWLKRVSSIDVLALAGLYTLRIIAGGMATETALSFWLLAFSMFIFLCLALVKRVAELIDLERSSAGTEERSAAGREYEVSDIRILQILGACSGYLAVLVLALYINSPEVSLLYATPELLWLVGPLMLLWITRLWIVTARGYMHDDPVFFALTDPETWLAAAFTAVILYCASTFTF